MKKKYIAVTLAATMAFGILAACSDKNNQNYTPTAAEERVPLVLGLEGADGVYNPFFATAAYDSEIAGQTQLSMFTTSPKGEIAYGDDQACVVKDYTTTSLDSNQRPTTSNNAAYTRYEFLIKNGIKFSDGVELTIDDVLFNLYVYLDPAYTGSATIYSTDIVGLEDYRTQGAGGSEETLNATAATRANNRLNRITQWCANMWLTYEENNYDPSGAHTYTPMTADEEAETEEDVLFFIQNYDTELESGYESAMSGFEEARKTYMFDAGQYWQYYLFTYGLVQYETQPGNGRPEKVRVKLTDAANGDYEVVDQDEYPEEDIENNIYEVYVFDFVGDSGNKAFADEVAALGNNSAAIREWAIETVYAQTIGPRSADENSLPAFRQTDYDNLAVTILGSSTTTDLYNNILADEISKLISYGGVSTISGITTRTTTSFNGKDLGGEYDVLSITINEIDPKAIWNFGFTVAPKHYYAPAEEARQYATEDHPYLEDIGIVYNSSDFMDKVLKNPERNRVPVGAGAYMASKAGGLNLDIEKLEPGDDAYYPEPGEFEVSKRIYYERNPYFDTVDGQEGGPIQNARIKYMQYQVVQTNLILQSLQTETIDVGNPNCTSVNTEEINRINQGGGHLGQVKTITNGYGYVGINAGKDEVSNIWIRRAIIKAMDTSMINGYTDANGNYQSGYFGAGNSMPIYRPMSTVSWAYPDGATVYRPSANETVEGEALDYTYDRTGAQIYDMLVNQGDFMGNGTEITADPDGNELMPIIFTVAGESTDHPAWQMFTRAKVILESIGFEITVEKDNQALTELTRGGLTVWAAAWSSTIDPDMYQVYHKNSRAGSTVNWGYNEFTRQPDKYAVENRIVDDLSVLIDDARETNNQALRAQYYADALDLVMELAVEMPAYQRYDLTVYNNAKIDPSTLLQNPTAYAGPFTYLWEVGYNSSFTVD